jgi:hypothetical protein
MKSPYLPASSAGVSGFGADGVRHRTSRAAGAVVDQEDRNPGNLLQISVFGLRASEPGVDVDAETIAPPLRPGAAEYWASQIH